jgi:colanic acid/amylovoran biosynthesis glycosyltransferase
VLQIAVDGSIRPCEFGSRELLGDTTDWQAAWRSPEFAALRTSLGDGQLPTDYCRECAIWTRSAMTAQAPLVRGYGNLASNPSDQPSRIVLQLPADGLTQEAIGQLGSVMADAQQLILACTQPLSEQLQAGWLAPLQALQVRPAAFLRLTAIGDLDACRAALRSIQINQMEVALDGADTTELAKAIALAEPHHAEVRARFVVTPSNWHWLEHTARAVAELGVQLDLHVLDYNGEAPMASIPVEDLGFAKDVFASAWQRHSGDRRPTSLAPHAHSVFVNELRGLLENRIQETLDATNSEDSQHLRLPSLDHPWHADSDYSSWFYPRLFGHSQLDLLHDWTVRVATGDRSEQTLRELTWLRVLCQKLAIERRTQELLLALRAIYCEPDSATVLLAADAAFADAFDLVPFGGPWTTLLRLHPTPRTAPFRMPAAIEASTDDAQITILIPSYKHGLYIGDTIRSALAQQGAPVKVLVVDDQSPDNTVEVARSIQDPRLEVRVNECNLGLGNSVLQVLDTIDTPYVALLNSDDVLHPERIARCLELLNADLNTQVVTTDLSLIDHNGGELTPDNASLVMDGVQVTGWVNWYDTARTSKDLPKHAIFEELLERNFLATSSNLTARTAWLREKRNAFQNLKYCLDWQIFLEAAVEGSLQHIAEPLAGYRLHATNTIWFEKGGRWAFFLEVNRVLVEALKHHVQLHGKVDEALVHRVTNAIAGHIAANREADGLALFLNTIMDGLAVDRIAADSERVQDLLRSLRKSAAAAVAARDRQEHDMVNPVETDGLRKQLVRIRQERLLEERDSLLQAVENLNSRVNNSDNRHATAIERAESLQARLTTEKQALRQKAQETREQLEKRIADVTEREQSMRTRLTTEKQALRQKAQETREQLEKRIADVTEREQSMRTRLTTILQELKDTRGKIEERSEEVARLRSEVAETTAQLTVLSGQRDRLQSNIGILRIESDAEIAQLSDRRKQLITEGSHLRAELEKLRNSREFRAGNFLWNILPLSYMSRRAKKWYSRLVDVKNRVVLWAEGKVKKSTAEGVAVVASCWHWPIYSHTFVYQEMIGLTHMGLDLKMFHWAENDLDQLQPAFAYLKDNRVQLKTNMKQHRKDKEHFEKTRPGRLDALLERLAGPTGKTVEELAEDPMVLRACTFARMAELASARYLHSYFFYDQSFMTFVAAWLLDIPRGVSCYADHMMDDFPFKVVALQLQMATVVVATSARIKTELVGIGGEECADKIVVKPNGVNGERFPAIDRGERKPEDPFEVISISRLEPKKGLEYLIEATAELKKRGRDIKVHIIGAVDTSIQASIDYGVELEHQIKKLGLENEVILHGMKMHEQIAPIMKVSRAFVAPYVELESGDKDGIPTAMLEALATGLPIVTTDAGSILEIVQDGVQALVTPQRDSKAYADALDKLITDPALERKLAKQARKRFDEAFDIKVTERRLHERVAAALQQTPVAP